MVVGLRDSLFYVIEFYYLVDILLKDFIVFVGWGIKWSVWIKGKYLIEN